MSKLGPLFFLGWLALLEVTSPGAQAATLTVTSLADSGPGTLRDQVAAANPGDTIDFSVTGTIQLLAPAISIAKNLTITGPGAGSLNVAGNSPTSGTNNFAPIFQITSGVVGLSGLTLRDGTGLKGLEGNNFVNYGGAIYVSGGTLTVSACTFTANRTRYGGALYVTGSATVTVTASAFTNNFGIEGGAIYLNGGSLSLVGSTVTGHTGGNFGGGIRVGLSSVLSISSCAFTGNSAAFGAGIYNGGTATVSNSTFSGNTAIVIINNLEGYGGGIFSYSDLTVTNSTFSGNIAQGQNTTTDPGGGGLYIAQGVARVNGCTITKNTGSYGGGVRNRGTLFVSNTIVAKNINGSSFTTDLDSSNGYSGGYNFIGDVDPMLAPLGNYGGPTQTHRPLPNSPVLDAGDPNFDATNTPYDQRGPGFPRVKNGRICIGAYESELNQSGNTFVVNTLDDHDDGLAGMTDCTLREAINAAPTGATIIFSVAGTMTLAGGELAIIQKSLNIQGPTSAPGLTISGNNASRIFGISQSQVDPPYTVNLSNLTLTGGNGVGTLSSGTGGAINTDLLVVLTVNNCTLTGNTATGTGGAIRSQSGLTVTNSTFTGNTATGSGGAIRCGGNVSFFHSTIVGNSSGSSGGGISKSTNGNQTLTLANCIVAGNTAGTTGPDVATSATVGGDYNLIQNPAGATFTGTHNLTGLAPQLAALADNGGPNRTMLPLPGSPVLNAGSNALRLSLRDAEAGAKALRHQKIAYDMSMRKKRFADARFVVFKSKQDPNVVFSGTFAPDYDFSGRPSQPWRSTGRPWFDYLSLSFVPTSTGWGYMLSWHAVSDKTCYPFAESLREAIANKLDAGDLLFRLLVITCENIAYRPSWIGQLPKETQEAILSGLMIGTTPFGAPDKGKLMAGLTGISGWKFDTVFDSRRP